MQVAYLCLMFFADFGADCTRCIDGDTIIVVNDAGVEKRVRLHGVDAPESKQPHGYESTFALAELCQGRYVNVIEKGKDQNGRTVAIVICDGVDVGEQLVADGHCWVDPRYSKSKLLRRYQESAKLLNRGLWAKPDPVEPWVWRKGKR